MNVFEGWLVPVISTFVALACLVTMWIRLSGLTRRMRALEATVRGQETRLARLGTDSPARLGDKPSTSLPTPDVPTPAEPGTAQAGSPALPAEAEPPQSSTSSDGPAPAAGRAPTADASPSSPSSVPPITGDSTSALPVPSNGGTFEERLGTKWTVYIGGAALALGGIFLVKHAIDMGLLGPAARIVLGVLLGVALAGLGVRMRLREAAAPTAKMAGADIPSVLTAAGTVVLFATTFAAYALYGFLNATQAFILLSIVAIATMYAAAIHGPWLAGLGLAASYATPLLVTTEQPEPWSLVIYLAVVTLAALKLARMRTWQWLTTASMIGTALWTLLMITGAGFTATPWDLPLMVHVVIQSAIAAFVIAIEPQLRTHATPSQPDSEANTVLSVVTALSVLTILAVPYAHSFHLTFAWVMIALLVVTAYAAPAASAAFLYSGLIATFVLAFWPGISDPIPERYTFGDPASLIRLPENISVFILFGFISSAAIAGTAAESLWRRSDLPKAITALASLAATAPPLLILIIEYLRLTQFGTDIAFSATAAILAVLYTYAADRFQKREPLLHTETARIPTGAFAAAAIAALCIALVAALERGYLTVAFALAALGTAYVASHKDIPILRVVVVALGAIVLGRIIWDPVIMGSSVGNIPVFNWLLVGYGVPAAAFAAASHYLRQRAVDTASNICDALAVLFAALLGIFEIRHFIHAGDPLAFSTGHVEMGLMTTLSLGLSFALRQLNLMRASPVFEVARNAASTVSVALAALGLLLVVNPAFSDDPVLGGSIFNTLLPAYFLPGALALVIARQTKDQAPPGYAIGAATLALMLIFAYVSLEVRFAYHSPNLGLFRGVSNAEMWSYTIAWLLLATAWLAYGLARKSIPARIASGVLLAVTIAKVALLDLSGITGVWRALSFLCLGAVLIAIGMVYQRLVFTHPNSKSS